MLYTHHSQFVRLGPNTTQAPATGSRFFCATCWQSFPTDRNAPGGTGYGIDQSGGMHCYSCCHVRDVAQLRDTSKPFFAYLSSDGRAVSNWPGAELGRVHSLGSSRSGWQGSRVYRFHVRDVHGNWWQGRGAGQGMCCTLRAMKKPAYAKHWGA